MNRDIQIVELPETPGSPSRRCPDASKIEGLTGYKAKIPLDDGLLQTYHWYIKRLDKIYE